MFDGFMSALAEDVTRTPQTLDAAAYRRKFSGLDIQLEVEQRRRTREFLPRFLRRKDATPS